MESYKSSLRVICLCWYGYSQRNNYSWFDIWFIDLQITKCIQLCNEINGNNGSFKHTKTSISALDVKCSYLKQYIGLVLLLQKNDDL